MIKCLAQGHKWGSSKVVPVLTVGTVGTAKMLKFLVESPYSQSSSTISTKTGMRKPENMTGSNIYKIMQQTGKQFLLQTSILSVFQPIPATVS